MLPWRRRLKAPSKQRVPMSSRQIRMPDGWARGTAAGARDLPETGEIPGMEENLRAGVRVPERGSKRARSRSDERCRRKRRMKLQREQSPF